MTNVDNVTNIFKIKLNRVLIRGYNIKIVIDLNVLYVFVLMIRIRVGRRFLIPMCLKILQIRNWIIDYWEVGNLEM